MATTRAPGREPSPADDEFLQHLYRGGELLAAGKVIEAKDFLERAHKLQPKNEKGQNLLGLAYFKLGLFDRAAELYEMLVRDNPVDPTLRVNLGLVYLKTNALQRAVREFEVAVDLAPDHQKAHNYLGLALAQQGEYGRAREHFLRAGSDAMAEKMGRAIAGEGFSRPAPVQPAKARGFSEIEGAEVVREHGGVPVPETPPASNADLEIEVVEESSMEQAAPEPPAPPSEQAAEAPAEPVAMAPRPPPPAPAEDDWGAQFGFDESGHPVEEQASAEASQPAEPEPSMEAPEAPAYFPESELSGSEGPVVATSNASVQASYVPSAEEQAPEIPMAEISEAPPAAEPSMPVLSVEEVSEDGMPVLTAEPENPEDLASIAQHEEPAQETQMFAAPVVSPEADIEVAFAEAPVAPPSPEPEAAPEVAPVAVEAQPMELPAASTAEPGPVPVPQAPVSGLAGEGSWRGGGVPLLGELASTMDLGGASTESPFTVGASGFSARVEGELLTRLDGLVAFTGQIAFTPEMKRFRGRTTDKPFGEGSARVVRATGRGVLFIEPAGQHTFQAVDLGDESAYFRDECVFAFEEPVMFENGRVPSEVAPDLDLVHLRGNGKVLLNLAGPLRSVRVTMDAPVTVPLTHLVGWQGNLTPRVVSLLQAPGGEVLKTAAELSGEGFALICLPVR
ncbi:MAG: tetratricopeptide repeat protein [Hyalangium sp.]|uniref:tetratricopeptide repeat protein n=1 Tax=Hyalangium sp. TaxID=2028555 RepID=UPI00389A6B90